MKPLTHPSIMLSRHIIYVCVCVCSCAVMCVRALVWFLGALKAGIENACVGIQCVHECIFVFLRIWKPGAFVSEPRPRLTSKNNTFSLQPVAQSHIINWRRSHSNVWTSPPLLGPERQMKLSDSTRPQRHVSQLVFGGFVSLCLSVFIRSISMNVCGTVDTANMKKASVHDLQKSLFTHVANIVKWSQMCSNGSCATISVWLGLWKD